MMNENQQYAGMKRRQLVVAFPFLIGIFIGTIITVFLGTAIHSVESDIKVQVKSNLLLSAENISAAGDRNRKVAQYKSVSYNVLVSRGELLHRGSGIHKTWGQGHNPSFGEAAVFYTPPYDDYKGHAARLKKMSVASLLELGKRDGWNLAMDSLVFKFWQRICDHKQNHYLWFAGISDDTYVRKDKLEKLLLTLNSSEPIFMGRPITPSGKTREDLGLREGENYCHKSCYIMSWKTLELVCPKLMSCQEIVRSIDGEVELARCIRMHAGINCTTTHEMKELFYYTADSTEAEDLQTGGQIWLNDKVISLSPLTQPNHFYLLHQHYINNRLKSTRKTITERKDELLWISEREAALDTFSNEALSPPWTRVGIKAPYQPPHDSHAEVIHWQQMSTDHVHMESIHSPVRPITALELTEIYQVTNAVVEGYMSNVSITSVMRRTDPHRGVDYFLQVAERASEGFTGSRMLHGMRRFLPPCVMTISPADYKSTKVNFVVPSPMVSGGFQRFIMSFENSFLSRTPPEQVGLLVVVYSDGKVKKYTEDTLAVTTLLHAYTKKYPQVDLRMISVRENFTRAQFLQTVSDEFMSFDLLFLADIHVDFSLQFLDRCRMNAVQDKQVYFPIVFSPYNPSKLLQDKILQPYATRFHLTGYSGNWLQDTSHTACLYNHDLRKATAGHRAEKGRGGTVKLLETFQHMDEMSVFRAVEPGLINMWYEGCKDVLVGSKEHALCARLKQ